jgi:Spy/CpxP family protein refolding chaperone
MRSWIRRTLFGVFGATIVLGSVAGCSHHARHGGWDRMSSEEQTRMRDKVMDRVAGRLDLDAEQKKKLAVVADRLMEQRTAFRAGKDTRTELQSLVSGDKFDRTKAQALLTEKTAAITAKSPEVIAAFGEFYDSLQPAQQAKVREAMQRRGGWFRG